MPPFSDRSDRNSVEPFLAPKPEGPEEISARVQRLREGKIKSLRRYLLERSGLDKLPAKRLLLVASLAVVEIVLLTLKFLVGVDIPTELLIAPALSIPALAFDRKNEKKAPTPDSPDS